MKNCSKGGKATSGHVTEAKQSERNRRAQRSLSSGPTVGVEFSSPGSVSIPSLHRSLTCTSHTHTVTATHTHEYLRKRVCGRQQDVLRLEITVNDVLEVEMTQSHQDLKGAESGAEQRWVRQGGTS